MRMRSVCRWRAAHCALYSSAVVYSVPCWTMPTPHTLGEAAAGQTAPLLLIPILTFFLLLLLMAGLRTQRHAAPRCLSEQIWWRRHWVIILYLNLIISSACNIGNLGQFVEQRATKMNIFFKLPIFSVITTFSMCCMVGLVGLDQVSEMKYSELFACRVCQLLWSRTVSGPFSRQTSASITSTPMGAALLSTRDRPDRAQSRVKFIFVLRRMNIWCVPGSCLPGDVGGDCYGLPEECKPCTHLEDKET